MVTATEQGTGQMGHGQANEHNRAAIGSDYRHQHTGTDDDQHPGPTDIQPEVRGIAVA